MYFSCHRHQCFLPLEADADGEISRVECEEYDTGASPCQESNCTRRKLCVGSPKAFCFATWKNIANGLQFIAKGCWSSNEYCVNSTVCIQSPSMRHHNFCCCQEPMCNSMVIAVNYTPSTLPIQTSSPKIKGYVKENIRIQFNNHVIFFFFFFFFFF